MSKKFPYGYDVNIYIEKAVEKMKELYPWVKREIIDERYTFTIEKIGNRYQYVSTYHWDDYDSREVLNCNGEEFINYIINRSEYLVQSFNKIKEVFMVPSNDVKILGGWYLERYEIRSHVLGGYSVFVQAGDRSAGASRTFFIPQSYFEGSYNEFLDKYIKLVSPHFGFTKDELLNTPGLKEFLGF